MKGFRKKAVALLSAGCLLLTSVIGMPVQAAEDEKVTATVTWEELDASSADAMVSVSTLEEIPEETEEAAYEADDTVRVFIVFESDSAIEKGYSTENIAENEKALDYMEKLEGEQEEVLEKVSEEVLDGEEVDVRYNFTLTTNAVSAEVTYSDIEAIAEVEGVEAVYIVPQYEVPKDVVGDQIQTTTAAEMVGSNISWLDGYTGAGMRIAIVDTGLDIDHSFFDAGAFDYAIAEAAAEKGVSVDSFQLLNKDEISSVLKNLNASSMYRRLSAGQVYQNTKVPFAFNYVDENLRITHEYDTQGEHGTHVAGIAAGNRYVPAGDSYAPSAEAVLAQGVAPDAQLLIMKVFGANGGAYSDDYAAAIEDAVMLGADAINLSLGSGAQGFTTIGDAYVQGIFDSLVNTDTVVSISSGNNGYWSAESDREIPYNLSEDLNLATNGSPGTYTNSLAVASADNIGVTGVFLNANDNAVSFSYSETASYGNVPFSTLNTEKDADGTVYDYVMFKPGIAGDEEGLYDGLDVTGKIVIVQRGSISFFVKANEAVAHGAAGVIIYNNTSGTIGLNLTGYEHTAPVISIFEEDGYAIAESGSYDEEHDVYTGTIVVTEQMSSVVKDVPVQMSSFSSWGANGNLNMKPEITAPGGNIYSSVDKGRFEAMSGTSMAAPSVAGLIALVKQYVEENGLAKAAGISPRVLVQSLLMGTATPIVDPDTGYELSVRQQGSGLANASDAIAADAYILVDGQADGKVKAEFGDDPEKTGKYGFTFTVNNLKDETLVYELDDSVLTADAFMYIDNQIYMDTVDTALDADVTYAMTASKLYYDFTADGAIDVNDALAVLQYANGKAALTPGQAVCADVDNDGVVTTNDAQMILAQTAGTDKGIDFTRNNASLAGKTLTVGPNSYATISVEITLADSDKEFFEVAYPNGGYVEGYIYLLAQADAEGVVATVDQSIPFLGVYGNWTDSSMFERSVYVDDLTSNSFEKNYVSHSGYTNYFTLSQGGNSYYYAPNPYALDSVEGQTVYLEETYIPERNAISVARGDMISAVNFSLIRNASRLIVSVTDAKTGEVYYEDDKATNLYAEYYNATNGAWTSLASKANIGWTGTDANGNKLAEGTEVVIAVTALPEYYNDGTHTPGAGASLTLPIAIDNTAPVNTAIYVNEDGELVVKAQDNRYVAAVALLDATGRQLIEKQIVNQTELGAEIEVIFKEPAVNTLEGIRIYNAVLCDYAGNERVVRVSFDPDGGFTPYAEAVALSNTSLTILKGAQATLTADVQPITAEDISVIWTSADESIATVNENGVVTGVAEGETQIIATAVLPNENGEAVSAVCNVKVQSIDVDLNAVLWDENGIVNMVNFNTSDLMHPTTLAYNMSAPYMAVASVGDLLMAVTYDSDNEPYAEYYIIDAANGYEEEYCGNSFWMTDMDIAPSIYQYGGFVGLYGNYLTIADVEDVSNGGVIDLGAKFGEDYFTGITYMYSGYYAGMYLVDYYLVMAESGEIYILGVTDLDGKGSIGTLSGHVGSTGIQSQTYYFNSIQYYEEGEDAFLFYSVYDDANGEQDLYVVDMNTMVVSDLGSFAPNVWPVSGLYLPYDSASEQAESIVATVSEQFELTNETLAKEVSFNGKKNPVTKYVKPVMDEVEASAEEDAADDTETEAVVEETAVIEETAVAETEATEEMSEESEAETEETSEESVIENEGGQE